ncbi:MAG: hypothetical protein A4E38_01929 [Methanoregulaceae archaeon PtaB.Bin108]|nr:MAG: hypothetical protein A4E38_01929 [Methanoregulaceae archaeon PtaB.Bin108]OPY41243.1 MAG: hypothetical protein A4E42_01867 [Methanoregulaceae archaeon PtaU1.Bin222]
MAAFWAVEPGPFLKQYRCPAPPAEDLLLITALMHDHMVVWWRVWLKSFGSS